MKVKVFTLTLALVMLLSGVLSAQEPEKARIGVLSFKNLTSKQAGDIAGIASEAVLGIFVKLGRFTPIERSQLEQILKEQALSQGGAIDVESAVTSGKIKGVDYVVIGSISQLDWGNKEEQHQNYQTGQVYTVIKGHVMATISLRVVETQTGKVIYTGEQSGEDVYEGPLSAGQSEEAMQGAVKSTIKKFSDPLYSAFPVKGYVIEIKESKQEKDGRQYVKKVLIDMGTGLGIANNTKVMVVRQGPSKKHPVTGKEMPGEQETVAELKVVEAKTNESVAEVKKLMDPIKNRGDDIKVGDVVISAEIKKGFWDGLK